MDLNLSVNGWIQMLNRIKYLLGIPIDLKIKKLADNAIMPKYAHIGDAGLDLYASSVQYGNKMQWKYGTGIALSIPKGFVGLIFPRSSIYKTNLQLSNSVGVIDSGYTGEIYFYFNYATDSNFHSQYAIGDRIGQLMVVPFSQLNLISVDELEETIRGNNGFGSTGR